jgi:DNA-binding SARP family transcriptional activator/tetratricopeptide (TPR) repeat protein
MTFSTTPGNGPAESRVRLLLLGPPTIMIGAEVHRPGTQKALALAGYLGVRGELVSRELLATLLWSAGGSSQARRSLRGELARLRAVLPEGAIGASRLAMWLDPSKVEVDVQQFRAMVEQGKDEDAVGLYRGPLFEGIDLRGADRFEEWLQSERHLFEIGYLEALRRLVAAGQDRGDAKSVLHWTRRALQCEPLAEDFYIRAMEAAEALHDRAAVLSIYRQLETVLRDELGVVPATEARALARRAAEAGDSKSPTMSAPTGNVSRLYIGHEHEQAVLRECIRQASAGTGCVAYVHGPAGAGKTRLVHAALGDRRTIWCRAQRPVSTVPFYPIATGLREYLSRWGVPAVDDLWLREAAQVCPELSRGTPNPSLGAPEDKVRLLEGLSVTLNKGAGQGGVLIFDDVQWADADTIAVLEDLVRRLPRLPLVITVIARSDHDLEANGVADVITASSRAGQLTDIPLGELSRSQVHTLIKSSMDDRASRVSAAWIEEFAGLVYEVLGGNPFYALECARLALDGSEQPPSEPHDAVKSGVRDVVGTRLAALPPRLRQLAEAAATAGEPIVPDTLARMLDIGPWELADRLDSLVSRRVMIARPGGLRFAHDLVAEVIYEGLPSAKRLLLHGRAAQALTSANAMDLDEVSGQIAAHLEAAGRQQEAIPHHERAAEAARRRHAHQMAIHHYQRLRTLTPRGQQTALLLRLGELLSYGTSGEAEAMFREALQTAGMSGDGHAQARCYLALGVLLRRRVDLTGSRQALTEALRRFEVYGDAEGAEQALEALTYAYIQQGELAAAAASAGRAAELARETGRFPNLGRATLSQGIAYLYGGEHARALRCFESARGVARETTDDLAEAEALRYLSAAYGIDGQLGTPDQAWLAAEKAIEICARIGHRTGLARAADGAGGAYLSNGEWSRALECYVAALHLTDTFGYAWGVDAMVYRVGYTLAVSGARERAHHVLEHAERLSSTLNAPYWLCRTHLARAELASDEDDSDHVRLHAAAALDLAKKLQHRQFMSKASAMLQRHLARASDSGRRGGAQPGRRRAARPAAPLPPIPPALAAPVHGVHATVGWLDELVDRQLAAIAGTG